MYRLIKLNICGRVYDCKVENFGGEFWLLHNCGGVDIVADDSNYKGSKRGNYYATKISRKECDITDERAIMDAFHNFTTSTYLVTAGEIIDKPQRIRKSNGGSDETPGNDAPKESTPKESTPKESTPKESTQGDDAPKGDIDFNIDLSDTINSELSALGKIGEMLAPSIVAAANIEANVQAKKVLNVAIDEVRKQAEERGGACKIVEYHTARGVYKSEKNEVSHAKIETVTKAVEVGIGVYLYGPTGTGKSYLAKQVAKRLSLDYYEASKIESVFDLIGFVDATGKYVWPAFAFAYIYGGLFFLDEFDASNSNAATAFHNALASNGFTFPGIGYKPKHENFRVIAAGNTIGNGAARDKYGIEYCSRNPLDAATLTRFPVKILCDYNEEIERHITYPYIGEKSVALIQFAHSLRAATAATNIQCTCCYREMETIAKLFSLGIDINDIFDSIFGHLDSDDIKMLAAKLSGGGAFVDAFKRLTA